MQEYSDYTVIADSGEHQRQFHVYLEKNEEAGYLVEVDIDRYDELPYVEVW